MENAVIDMTTLEEVRATMKQKFGTIIQYFLEDGADYISSIKIGLAGGNISSASTAAHTLKSSSRQLGAIKLSDIAKDIEEAARNGSDAAAITTLLPKLEAAFSETTLAFRRI